MIKLSNSHKFEYMVASGALGFDGKGWPWEYPLKWIGLLEPSLFTVVIKTLTRHPRRGNLRWYNPFRCVRLLSGGVVNALGLPNPGIKWWCKNIGPSVNSKKIPLMGSIFGEPEELAEMAKMLNGFDLVGLEINASCPNIPNIEGNHRENTWKIVKSCKKVKSQTRFPLILKIAVNHDIGRIIPYIEDSIEAISINSVPWELIFPYCRSPLAHLGGGAVSGKRVQPFTWRLVKELAGSTAIPVIGPSVWEFDDIEKLRKLGAKAISFGSVFLRYPWRPTLFVQRDMKRKEVNKNGSF